MSERETDCSPRHRTPALKCRERHPSPCPGLSKPGASPLPAHEGEKHPANCGNCPVIVDSGTVLGYHDTVRYERAGAAPYADREAKKSRSSARARERRELIAQCRYASIRG